MSTTEPMAAGFPSAPSSRGPGGACRNGSGGLGTRFVADTSGSLSLIFVLALGAILLSAGCAVDYGMALKRRDRAAGTLDLAVLAAASTIRDRNGLDPSGYQAVAEEVVDGYLAATEIALVGDPVVRVEQAGLGVSVKATLTGGIETTILSLVGISSVSFSATASSVVDLAPYVDVTLIIDTSASMALGATSGDIQRLSAQWGCAFACHDNPGADSFAWAAANGVTLRYDLIRDAVRNFADYVDTINGAGRVRVQVYTFDDVLRLDQALTADMGLVRAKLPTAPQTSSEYAGGTRWWTFAGGLPDLIGTGGDGSAVARPIKLVMILTDGVQDPNRTWTWNVPLRDYVREFDWAPCDAMRERQVKVGVVQVPYLEMDWDWGFRDTLGLPSRLGRPGVKRLDDVSYALKQCGGNLHSLASDPAAVSTSFSTLFKTIIVPRLTR